MPPRKRPEIIDVDPVEPVERKWDMDLDELDAQITEALGAPAFNLRLRNGDALVVRPAVLLPDDRAAATMRVENGEDLDPVEHHELRSQLAGFLDAQTLDQVWKLVEPHTRVPGRTIGGELAPPQHIRMAKAILGEEDYARLLAGGGSSYRVMYAFGELNAAVRGGDDPKSGR